MVDTYGIDSSSSFLKETLTIYPGNSTMGKRERSYHLCVVGNKIQIDTAAQGPKASSWSL